MTVQNSRDSQGFAAELQARTAVTYASHFQSVRQTAADELQMRWDEHDRQLAEELWERHKLIMHQSRYEVFKEVAEYAGWEIVKQVMNSGLEETMPKILKTVALVRESSGMLPTTPTPTPTPTPPPPPPPLTPTVEAVTMIHQPSASQADSGRSTAPNKPLTVSHPLHFATYVSPAWIDADLFSCHRRSAAACNLNFPLRSGNEPE